VKLIHDSAFYRTKMNLLEVAASALQRVAELEDRCGERPTRTDLCATPCTSTALVKLPAPTGTRNSVESITVAGDTLVVGSTYENGNSGAAYVFSRQTSGAWVQTQRLVASDGTSNDYFPLDIALDGNTLVIGSMDAGGNKGAAYVFTLQAGVWTETKKLMADGAASDQFGLSVAVCGDTLVVGDFGYDDDVGDLGSHSGSAYVFSLQRGAWMQSTKLLASDGATSDNFGWSVAVSPGLIAVGAPRHDHAGAVYMYTPDASGSWTQAQKLKSSEDEGTNARFGYSLAAFDGTVVIGMPYLDYLLGGSVYVFSCTVAGVCAETDVLRAADEAPKDNFGVSIAISCSKIVVGASLLHDNQGQNPGSVYTFSWHQARGWAQTSKIVPTNRAQDDGFGHMVAISSHTVAAVDSLGSAHVKEVCDS